MNQKISAIVGVVFLVCTFGSTSNISNDTIITLNSTIASLIINETITLPLEVNSSSSTSPTPTELTTEAFELPETCSNYKVMQHVILPFPLSLTFYAMRTYNLCQSCCESYRLYRLSASKKKILNECFHDYILWEFMVGKV